MSVSKPSICYWKRVISINCRNKLLIHNIKLTGHRKSTCCLQLLVFQMSHCSVLALEDPGFFHKSCCHHDLKAFCETGVLKCTFKYYRKHEIKMTCILFKFIIYPSCERTLKNGRVKSEIVRKSSFGDMIFLTWHDIVTKKVLLLKYRKLVSHLKNRYDYARVVENARISFSIRPYCTLLFSRKENFKSFEVALSPVFCNGAVGCIMNEWGYC